LAKIQGCFDQSMVEIQGFVTEIEKPNKILKNNLLPHPAPSPALGIGIRLLAISRERAMDKSILQQHARTLWTNSTDTEKHLWYYLRANRMGYKFKRQVPVKHFIVDFVYLEKHLIIELEGGQHQENQAYDKQRTIELEQFGFQVLRFWNNDTLTNTAGVLEVIRQALSPTLTHEKHNNSIQIPSVGEGAAQDLSLARQPSFFKIARTIDCLPN
jgi:very-short-patch-repair endonuclease